MGVQEKEWAAYRVSLGAEALLSAHPSTGTGVPGTPAPQPPPSSLGPVFPQIPAWTPDADGYPGVLAHSGSRTPFLPFSSPLGLASQSSVPPR